MARYERTEGLCLRRVDYSNTSQVVSFLTPESGRMSFMAKGVIRAPKRGVRCSFDLLERYDLVYARRSAGSLHNLTASTMAESFPGIRKAVERVLCACYAAELVLRFTEEEDPCPRLYEVLLRTLRRLALGQSLGRSVLLLELATLREHGSCPEFSACAECGGTFGARERALCAPAHGGPLCERCAQAAHKGPSNPLLPVSGRHLHLLARIAGLPPGAPDEPGIPPADVVAASSVLHFHMRYLLGREMRMWKYLQDQHLSRTLKRIRRSAEPRRPGPAEAR